MKGVRQRMKWLDLCFKMFLQLEFGELIGRGMAGGRDGRKKMEGSSV